VNCCCPWEATVALIGEIEIDVPELLETAIRTELEPDSFCPKSETESTKL